MTHRPCSGRRVTREWRAGGGRSIRVLVSMTVVTNDRRSHLGLSITA